VAPDEARTAVPRDSEVYYAGRYWNDHPTVQAHICQQLTGDPRIWWTADFRRRFCATPFGHGLFLNCGNGWVEREFLDQGMVERATAFDYSEGLLAEADRRREGRPIRYLQADANRVEFGEDEFDLVVNVGALHHVQYIERLAEVLCRCLRPNGVLVAYDYVGPARNQYSRRQWRLIRAANRRLPRELRKPLMVPRPVPYMLWSDPTEAIHSDAVLEALSRRFEVFERHDAGGGLAYEVLTHNRRFFAAPAGAEVDRALGELLAEDRTLTVNGVLPPMFSYYLARPRKESLADPALAAYRQAENAREARAARHLGAYSTADWLLALVTLPVLRAGGAAIRHLRRRYRGV
jgi:SAM-dependent methyltransferase